MRDVKICGVKTPAVAAQALEAGASYVGVVLAESRRRVSLDQAARITERVPGRAVAVVRGVPDGVWEGLWELDWGGLQVHDRPPDTWVPRAKARGWLTIQPVRGEGHPAAEVWLWDGPEPGSGRPMADDPGFRPAHRLWVAGGLTRETVAAALDRWRPDGVDVSSGVERDGEKDLDLVAAFIEEVRGWERRQRGGPA